MGRERTERRYMTPPAVAAELGVAADKILRWIATGELPATNLATGRAGRPRWHISQAALEEFLAGRQATPKVKVARRRKQMDVTEYF